MYIHSTHCWQSEPTFDPLLFLHVVLAADPDHNVYSSLSFLSLLHFTFSEQQVENGILINVSLLFHISLYHGAIVQLVSIVSYSEPVG
jgi:hypothetical protein